MNTSPIERQIENYLSIEAEAALPAAPWWTYAVGQAVERRRQTRWWGSRARLAWIVTPLAVLLIAGIAYASSSVIRERFMNLFPQVEHAGLAQAMNLSQTIDGVTVTIERAYADSNGVLVGYTVAGPPTTATGPGARYLSRSTASLANGQKLPGIFELGTVPGSPDILGDWNPDDRLAVVAGFDASQLEGTFSELSVVLTIKVFDRVPLPDTQPVQQTFSFEFNVMFHPAKVVQVGKEVTAAGVPITIEQLVISPWETRVVYSFAPPYDEPQYRPATVVSLTPAGADPIDGISMFFGDFTGKSGEWVLTIRELIFFDGMPPGIEAPAPENENGQIRPQGPWTVRFNVP